MKQRWILIRNTVAAIGFLGTIGFGVAQATTTRAPAAPSVGCSSFACRAECAPFGLGWQPLSGPVLHGVAHASASWGVVGIGSGKDSPVRYGP